ncbi:MAG: alpha-glucosidase/alpha-galactosidase, partial [Phycisphaerae bacterium]
MAKIAIIGAGSLIFTKTPSMDILATEALEDSELCLMDLDKLKLDRMEAFVQRVIDENGKPAKVTSTLERAEAL